MKDLYPIIYSLSDPTLAKIQNCKIENVQKIFTTYIFVLFLFVEIEEEGMFLKFTIVDIADIA